MGNSQPNSPAKKAQVRNKRLHKQQQQQEKAGKQVIGEQCPNYNREIAKSSKEGDGRQRKQSLSRDSSDKFKKSDVNPLRRGIKVLKDGTSDRLALHSGDGSRQKKKLSDKSKVIRETSFASKDMAIREEPLVPKIGGQHLKHIGGESRETTPNSSFKDKDRLYKHIKRRQHDENRRESSQNSTLVTSDATVATNTIIGSGQDLSGNISTASAPLPPLVELRSSQSELETCLKGRATCCSSGIEKNLIGDSARLNRGQMGVTSKNDEIRVISAAVADKVETEVEKFPTTIVDSTSLPQTTSLDLKINHEKEGALSLIKGTNADNSNGISRDGENNGEEEEDDESYDRLESFHNNESVQERASSEGVSSNATLNLFPSFGRSNLISKNSSTGQISSLPPLVAQKSKISVQNNRAIKGSSEQPAFSLSRSFSVNTILANGAHLLNLSSVVAQMKTKASDYTVRGGSPLRYTYHSPSSTTTTATTATTPTKKVLPAATARLPMINDTLMMMQSTSLNNSLMFRLSSVEDQRQKVKNWLESQPLLATNFIVASSSSIDQLEGEQEEVNEEEKLGKKKYGKVRGQDQEVGVEEIRQEESHIKWDRKEAGWKGVVSREIGSCSGNATSCSPLVTEQDKEEEGKEKKEVVEFNREVFGTRTGEAVSGNMSELFERENSDDLDDVDNKVANTRTQARQTIVAAAISDLSELMDRKLATNKAKNQQDDCQYDGALLVKGYCSTRSHLFTRHDDYDDDIDSHDKDEICTIKVASSNNKRESNNQVNDGNFVIRDQRQVRKDNLQNKIDEQDDNQHNDERRKRSDATEEFCLKGNKIVDAASMSSTSGGLVRTREGCEDIDEILDEKPEALEEKAKVAIVGVNVYDQVTDKSRPYSSRSSPTSSPASLSSSSALIATKLSFSSSKSGAIENIRQQLADSLSSMQMSSEQSKLKLGAQSVTLASTRTENPQVGTSAAVSVLDHSDCSLCNYLNSIRILEHHEQCNNKPNCSCNLAKSCDGIVNNNIEQRSQLENEGKQKQRQQQQELQFKQWHQVEHGNEGEEQFEEVSSSSIKPRELLELSIWNNLEANLSADVYKYELEANLMIRKPTKVGGYSCLCCGAKDNYRNNESGIVDTSGSGGINGKVHKSHALNNQAFQLLHNDQEEKGNGGKIDEALCDADDRVVSKDSASSNLESLLGNLTTNDFSTVSPQNQTTTTTTTTTAATTTTTSANYTRKQPALKCLRGLSLDSNNRQAQYSIPAFRKRLNSRRLLMNQGRSHSTKLILIKSNNASYTIQATPSSLDFNVEVNSIKGENEQEELLEQQQQPKQNQVKTISKNLGNQASIRKHNEQSSSICYNNVDDINDRNRSNVTEAETEVATVTTTKSRNDNNSGGNNKRLVDSSKQTLNQFGLCKKFLVKKIKKSCSNRKLLLNKQQASYRQTFHAVANSGNDKQAASVSNSQFVLTSSQKLIYSKRVSTSIIDHRSTSNKIAFNKSNSTDTIESSLNKTCRLPSSKLKSELFNEPSSFRVVQTTSTADQYQLNSILSEPSKEIGNKPFESLSSELLEFISFDEEEKKNQRGRSSILEELGKKQGELALKQAVPSLIRQQSGGTSKLEDSSSSALKERDTTKERMGEEERRKQISTRQNIGESELNMDTVRMKIQGTEAVEVIDADGLSSIETARSCGVAAKRLRELVAHLEHGSVPQSILYQTLEYAASVLDSVTMDQISRVSDEEDGDLSEVQSDAVPNEVRKWLETTFTRNSISQKRKSEDKLKFRSVANAIRAGIVVDRIYRRTSACIPFVSQEVSNLLKNIDDWSFDCFSVNQVSNGQVLKSVGYELFNRYGLIYKFKIPTTTLKNFLTQIEVGYVKHKNPYHNNLHAADVTQTVHYMLWQAGLTNWLTDLEIFATLLAAIIHDYLHTGTTNNFHVMSQSDTALIYNDRAVLENFHICQAFTLMKNEDCNILANLSKDEYREFRSLVIDMVLATDMSSHFQQIKAMKNILNHSDNFNADKSKILSLVIHISDISHPAKEWELHSTWTRLLMEEFFRQGDREKELDLECSPLCDRETTLVAESQLGFIEFIVSPSLEVCGDVLDRVHYQMAEANSRPVLPASAKAVSMVAANANQSTASKGNQLQAIESSSSQQTAIEAGSQKQEEQQQRRRTLKQASLMSDSSSSSVSALGSVTSASSTNQHQHHHQQQQQQPQQLVIGPRCPPPSQSSIASSFVSSDSITSNLRKMIVSSSATIGRKLNISSSSSSSQNSTISNNNNDNNNNHGQQQAAIRLQHQQLLANKVPGNIPITSINSPIGTTISTIGRQQSVVAGGSVSDFETRQANYKHPVIQSDPRPKSAGSRFKQAASSDTSFLRQDDNSSELQQPIKDIDCNQASFGQQQHSPSQLSRLTQPTEGVIKRSSNSALSTCSQVSCPANMQTFKILRPWVTCLERNKKIWHERAITDAQARELKEKLKQQQIESAQGELKNLKT